MKRRDWKPMREKVQAEGRCRVCRTSSGPIDAAHVIPRSLAPGVGNNMEPENCVPLCRRCHDSFDTHQLDLTAYLTLPEQLAAVTQAGGLYAALRIISGRRDL